MTTRVDAVVVGSGPGGAVTARALAAAGLSTLVLEEGAEVPVGAVSSYSLEQMRRQYRNQGLTVALGRPSVAYTEGRCLGGGSEVNSGLYHRPPAAVLDEWAREYRIDDLTAERLAPVQQVIERELSVRQRPPELLPTASTLLRRGAESLGWQGFEVPQWVRIDGSGDGTDGIQRQTMSRTYLPAAQAAGAEIRTDVSVRGIDFDGPRACGVRLVRGGGSGRGGSETVRADAVFICAGATQTPALLQRSGVRSRVGGNLSVHPTVKVVAEFDDDVNAPTDLATYQVKEFGSWLSFGGSASTPALLALAHAESGLAGGPGELARRMTGWRRQIVYYAATQSQGRGRVRSLPGFHDPLVTYRLTGLDHRRLASAQARLVHLAMAMGAHTVHPAFPGALPVHDRLEAAVGAGAFAPSRASLMTVHLTGTAPMGEDRSRCAVDSFGRVHERSNLYVNDASLLPWAPGVNPQGAVMAVAQRNVDAFLAGSAG